MTRYVSRPLPAFSTITPNNLLAFVIFALYFLYPSPSNSRCSRSVVCCIYYCCVLFFIFIIFVSFFFNQKGKKNILCTSGKYEIPFHLTAKSSAHNAMKRILICFCFSKLSSLFSTSLLLFFVLFFFIFCGM